MKIELLSLDEIDPCQLAIHANDPLVNRYLKNSFPFPYTLDHAMRFITHSLEHNALDFGIVVDGICIGCVGATFHKDVFIKNCEIGYWIGVPYWGMGLIPEAVRKRVVKMFCDYLFSHFTITKIYAEIYSENIASCHVLEANGFQKEGYLKKHVYKNNNYHDLIIYGLREEEYEY